MLTACGVAGTFTTTAAQEGGDLVKQLIGNAVGDVGPQYKDVEDAITRFRYRDFDGALDLLKTAKQKNPQLAPASVMMAQLYVAAKDTNAAREALERAVTESPKDPEAYVLFGESALQQRRLAEAELLFAKSLSLLDGFSENPKRKKDLATRASIGASAVAASRDNWSGALAALEKAVAVDPQSVNAHTRIARAQFELGAKNKDDELIKKAYSELQEVYKLDSSQPRPEINMALLYQQHPEVNGADQLAQNLMSKAAERDANSETTQMQVAQWALENGNVALAKQCLDAAKKINASSFQVNLLDGLVARFEKNLGVAEVAFERAHLLQPSNAVVTNQLSIVLVEQEDEAKRRKALEYSQQNARLFTDMTQPVAREAAITFAWVLFRLGQVGESERLIQQALAAGNVTPDSAYFAARILEQRGRTDEAARLIKTTLDGKAAFPYRQEATEMLSRLGSAAGG